MAPTERADRLAQLDVEIAAAEQGRDLYNQLADEARDQSYEESAPQARDAYMGHATRLRAQAMGFATKVFELRTQRKALEAAPVVLTAEQCADIDDTMNAQVAA